MDDIFTPPPRPPFANSMEYGNFPEPDAATSPEDERSGMGPERKVSKNSGADTSVDPHYPLPKDPHSPEGKDYGEKNSAEISDFGLNEKVDVGHNASVNQYGLVK